MSSQYLRSAIERLATIERPPCSSGEREAAEWIAAELRGLGAEATVELERIHGSYWWPLGITSGIGILADGIARRGSRLLGAALAGAAASAVFDELTVGRRVLRRVLPKQTTANVVAPAGDLSADRTLVIVAHHDAAHTSIFFDPRITARVAAGSGSIPDDPPAQPLVMAPIAIGPGLVALGSLLGMGRLSRLGALLCAGVIASFVEIGRQPVVPGANDNLSAVATLLGLARALKERPVQGLRVLLVSTGSEESLMEGMRAFAARYFPAMPKETTHLLALDSVGSPHLVLAEAEGMLRMFGYDEEFKELISACAGETGVAAYRGFRIRLGTDGIVALRHGYTAAMLMSVDEHGAPSNYHLLTDTPDRVDYSTLEDTVRLCDAVIRRLSADGSS